MGEKGRVDITREEILQLEHKWTCQYDELQNLGNISFHVYKNKNFDVKNHGSMKIRCHPLLHPKRFLHQDYPRSCQEHREAWCSRYLGWRNIYLFQGGKCQIESMRKCYYMFSQIYPFLVPILDKNFKKILDTAVTSMPMHSRNFHHCLLLGLRSMTALSNSSAPLMK